MLSRIQSRIDSNSIDLFFELVKQNNTSGLIDIVLSTHCDPRYIRNEKQQTLLHVACHNGVIDMVRILVEIYQCNPLLSDRNSLTAYHYACLSGNLEAVSYLFRISDRQFITDYLPPESFQGVTQTYFKIIIDAASQSRNTETLRFLFHHLVHERNTLTLNTAFIKINS